MAAPWLSHIRSRALLTEPVRDTEQEGPGRPRYRFALASPLRTLPHDPEAAEHHPIGVAPLLVADHGLASCSIPSLMEQCGSHSHGPSGSRSPCRKHRSTLPCQKVHRGEDFGTAFRFNDLVDKQGDTETVRQYLVTAGAMTR